MDIHIREALEMFEERFGRIGRPMGTLLLFCIFVIIVGLALTAVVVPLLERTFELTDKTRIPSGVFRRALAVVLTTVLLFVSGVLTALFVAWVFKRTTLRAIESRKQELSAHVSIIDSAMQEAKGHQEKLATILDRAESWVDDIDAATRAFLESLVAMDKFMTIYDGVVPAVKREYVKRSTEVNERFAKMIEVRSRRPTPDSEATESVANPS